MPIVRIVTPRQGAGKSPASPSTNGHAGNGTDHNGNGTGGPVRRIVHVRRRLDLPDNLVGTDSEWDHNSQPADPWLSTAFVSTDPTAPAVVCFRDDIPAAVRERLEAEAEALCARLIFLQRTDNTDLLEQALPYLGRGVLRSLTTDLAIFYSPKDVEYSRGWKRWHEALHEGTIWQRHGLIGHVAGTRLRDLKGWAGPASLLGFAKMLGRPMPDKTALDDYKDCMRRGLEERPREFLRYAIEDARVLPDLFSRFVNFMRQIQSEILGMKENLWHAGNIPMTIGRLVAETFQRWLYSRAGAHEGALRFCLRKLGHLNPHAPDYQRDRQVRTEVLARVRSVEDLDMLAQDKGGRGLLRKFLRARYWFTALDGASVRWWLARDATETAGLNALVQGARCNNERPDAYQCGHGLDIDISGCYGASLRTLLFPIGRPSVWSYETHERRPTLEEWLTATEGQRVDGLWTCTVSGPLSFEQDLLYSKILGDNGRRHTDPDGPDIPADFALLRRELHNAILTSDLLAALRAVATKNERSELMQLEVVTAVAYLKKDRRDDVGDWCRGILASPAENYPARVDAGVAQDRRPHDWFGVPLEEFSGRLVDERQRLQERQKTTADPDEQRRLDGLQAVLKLIINTLYGDFTSRHFAIGNTVLGNNITARARLGVWMLAKALGLRQTITDGGFYTPAEVPHWKERQPGLDTLSRMWAWADPKHGRTLAPLPGLGHWNPDLPVPEDADAAALAHVQKFWDPYGLKYPFEIVHKLENTFRRAAYWSKGDYALLKLDGKIKFKIRAKNRKLRKDEKEEDLSPQHRLLTNIIAGTDIFPTDLSYTRGGLLKVGMYLRAQSSRTGYQNLKRLRPGDDLPEEKHIARFNNTHMPLTNLEDFRRRQRRKKKHNRQTVLWFERFGPRGIAAVHAAILANRLRRVVRKTPAGSQNQTANGESSCSGSSDPRSPIFGPK
jgi:hypothetical protein